MMGTDRVGEGTEDGLPGDRLGVEVVFQGNPARVGVTHLAGEGGACGTGTGAEVRPITEGGVT